MMLFILNADFDGYPIRIVAAPKRALLIDICFAVFLVLGSTAAIELWCRAHEPPKMSLLSLFAVLSAICLYFSTHMYVTFDNRVSAPYLWMYLSGITNDIAFVLFGVAVVGWGKMIGLAIKALSSYSVGREMDLNSNSPKRRSWIWKLT